MKVSCVLLVNDPCRQLQDRFTPPARPWFASGGGHMSWKPFVVGVDASPEAAGAAAFACRVAEQAGAGCRLVHATRDVLAAVEVPEVAAYRRAIAGQAGGRPVGRRAADAAGSRALCSAVGSGAARVGRVRATASRSRGARRL